MNILHEKVDRVKQYAPEMYLNFINIDTLINAGRYIDNLKPKSKYRDYKHHMLLFIENLEIDNDLQKKEIVELSRIHLNSIILFLVSEHGFKQKDDWFWSGLFNLVLDIVLILTGIARYYYYVPIFTIIAVFRNIRQIKKAKKENKYLDL